MKNIFLKIIVLILFFLVTFVNADINISQKAHAGVMQFNGTSYIIASEPNLTTYNTFTSEAWFQPSYMLDGTNYDLVRVDDQLIRISYSGGSYYLLVGIGSGLGYEEFTTDISSIFEINNWNHVTMTYDGDFIRGYINGEEVINSNKTNDGNLINGDNDNNLTIGISTTTTYGYVNLFKGLMDEVRVWNIARSSTEINSTMNKQLDGNESGLVAYYNFDEVVGNIVIDIANSDYNGTIEGNGTRLNFLGDGLNFDGDDDYVNINDDNSTNTHLYALDGNITLSSWIKIDGLHSTTYSEVISRYGTSNGYILRVKNSSGIIQMVNKNADTEHNISSTKAITDNLWHYIVATYDGSYQRLYIDGIENNSTYVGANAIGASAGTLTFGATSTLVSELKGNIAETSIWNRALSEREINKYMYISLDGNESGLLGYWSLNEGDGNITYDRSSYANEGNISGAEWNTTAPIIYGNNLYTQGLSTKIVKLNVENNITEAILADPLTPANGSVDFNSSFATYSYIPTDYIDDTFIINANDTSTEANLTINIKKRNMYGLIDTNESVNFGLTDVAVTKTLTINNLNLGDLIIDNVYLTNSFNSTFEIVNNCSTALSANTSCDINITYTPQINDFRATTLQIESNDAFDSNKNIMIYGYGQGFGEIKGNANHSLAVKRDNTLWAWGNNLEGQLGDGTNTDSNTPIQILTDVISVDGYDHTLALKKDGTLWAWGNNTYGQLGDENDTNLNTPTQISLNNIVKLETGGNHSMVLDSNGKVWSWGYNANGELGDGNNTDLNIPTKISSLTDIVSISAGGNHNLALKNDGSVWSWGKNHKGQLGDNSIVNNSTPTKISSLSNIIYISAGNAHNFAIKNDGTIWGWGYNGVGALGDGTNTDRYAPTQITSLTDILFIESGGDHTLALDSNNILWSSGYNVSGQLGDGNNTDKNTFTQISSLSDIKIVIGGDKDTLAVDNNGSVWSFGDNTYGQLGDETIINKNTPTDINFNLYTTNIQFNLTNINLSEHNITSIKIYGVDDNSEEFNLTNLIDGDNNFTTLIYNFDNNYSIELNVSVNTIETNWYYNFNDGLLYPDNNLSDEFKNQLNITNNLFLIDTNSINWNIPNIIYTGEEYTLTKDIIHNNNLTIEANATLYTDDYNLTIDGDLILYGSIISSSNITVKGDTYIWLGESANSSINDELILNGDLTFSSVTGDSRFYQPFINKLSLNSSSSQNIYMDSISWQYYFNSIELNNTNEVNFYLNNYNGIDVSGSFTQNSTPINIYSNGTLISTTPSFEYFYFYDTENYQFNTVPYIETLFIDNTQIIDFNFTANNIVMSYNYDINSTGEISSTPPDITNLITAESTYNTLKYFIDVTSDSGYDLNLITLPNYNIYYISFNNLKGEIKNLTSTLSGVSFYNTNEINISNSNFTLEYMNIDSYSKINLIDSDININSSLYVYDSNISLTNSDLFTNYLSMSGESNYTKDSTSSFSFINSDTSLISDIIESSPTPTPTATSSVNVTPYVESESESVVEEITTDSFSEDSGVTLEISEDGSTNFNVTSVSESGEVVETQTELPSGTEISINEAGEIEQSFVSEDGTEIKLTTSQTGKVTLKVTTANGEEVSFEAPAGTKLKIAEDGSSKQDYSTKDSKTELKISATGESELNLKSEDGNKVELKSELAGKTELKESGGFKQSFETGDNKISIEGSKQANSQAVIELPNLKLTLTPPKNGKVSVKKDGSVSIANDTITSIGTVKSEMRVNPDTGDASVEVNIQSNQRGVVPKKIFYSTRKDISNIKLEVILDERKAKSRAFNSSKSKTGKIKAVFSTRKSFNFKENISREVSNSSLGVTPLSDAEFEENLYFDNSQELKLKSGSANIKGFFSTRGSFSNKRKTTNTDLINNRDFSMKSNSAIMSENNIIATLNEGNLKTDLQANSNGDLNINITNFTNTKRGLKTTAKKLFYSVRKDFSNVKVEIIENSNQRGFKSPKIKTLFSTRESFNFKSSNLRTVDEIEIIPVDENTTFTENILEDGSRYIELISGTASINSETMILNKSYELPALELIEVVEDLIINQEVKLELQKEWNLISTPISEDISDKFIFQDYDLIWNFKDNNWVKNPSILYYEDGYWIKTDSENNITFKGSSYTPNLKRVVSTWALVGTGTEINDINNLISEEKIKEIYQFKDNKWLKSNDINSLNIGDGFWIKKIPADFIFNIKEGWNLLSLPTKEIISNMSIFGDYEEILIYDNKEWIKNPNQIKPMQGFWINSNENISLAFYGEGYNIDINSLSIGWSLVGGNINFENLKFSEIKSILLFKNDKWTTVDSFKNIDLIKKSDGFWILK